MVNPITQVKNGKVDIIRAKSSKRLLNHGYLFYDEELTVMRQFAQNVSKYSESLTPAQKNVQFDEILKKLMEYIKKSYEYNNYIMEKCYDGVYVKNIDTLKPKVDFLKKITQTFMKLIALNSSKVSEAQKGVMELYDILLDNIEKQADHLQTPIFKSQGQQSTNLASKFRLEGEGE